MAIVSESMARALWPDTPNPTGRRMHIGLVEGPLLTVHEDQRVSFLRVLRAFVFFVTAVSPYRQGEGCR